MTIVRHISPFGELMSLRSAMDRLFEDSFVKPQQWTAMFGGASSLPLPIDVSTTADELLVRASLPGWKAEDVEIAVEGRTLTISGQTQETREENEGDQGFLVREIRRGSFSRSLTLPEGLEPDKATAEFDNGILTLRLPKAEQVKPRQIRISPVTNGTAIPSSAGNENTGETATPERSPVGAKA
jgi:HSP20 family protein